MLKNAQKPASLSRRVHSPATVTPTLAPRARKSSAPLTFARYSLAKATRPDQNEDRILSLPRTSLGAVFDGVGGEDGYVGSLVASQTVRSHWKKVLSARQVVSNDEANPASNADLLLLLEYVILQAHHRLCAESTRRTKDDGTPLRPCTTIALAALDYQPHSSECRLLCAHVGDSRIYLLKANGDFHRLTDDDGFFSLLVAREMLTLEDAWRIDQASDAAQLSQLERAYFERRNGITQALGDQVEPVVHLAELAFEPGDRVLLCTDGVHDNLTDIEIAAIMRASARTTTAKKLVQRALEVSLLEHQGVLRAKQDDISALVISRNY